MNFDILRVLVYSGASLMIHLYRSRSSQGGEGASLGVFFVGKEGKGECLMVLDGDRGAGKTGGADAVFCWFWACN